MCAGASAAKTANENTKRQYDAAVEKRKRGWFAKLSIYKAATIQYAQASQNIHTGMTRAWDRAQERLQRVKEATAGKNQDILIKMFQDSKYGNLMASGATGRSIARIGVMENAALGQFYSRNMRELTDAREDFMAGVKNTRYRAKISREREWVKVWQQPVEPVAIPRPVYQNVGWALFGDIMGFASTAASFASMGNSGGGDSERIIKYDIKKIGTAKSGLGVYKFKYIDIPDKTYVGTMVDEVEKIFPEAVSEGEQGLMVNYDMIDVEFRELV